MYLLQPWNGLVLLLYKVLPFKNNKNFDVIVSHKIGSLVITVVIFQKWRKWSFFKKYSIFKPIYGHFPNQIFLQKWCVVKEV